MRHPWPGNVRELENATERAAALGRISRIELDDLPEEVRPPTVLPIAPRGGVLSLEQVAKDHILATLERNGGNEARTAEQLEIGSVTLYRELKCWGMTSGSVVAAEGQG